VQEEDAQLLSEPIITPLKIRKFAIAEKDLPVTRFERSYLMDMTNFPETIRNVVILGNLHHGKTSLVDMLVFQTHQTAINLDQPERYTDTHVMERSRAISIKSSPMSLLCPNSSGKSYLLNVIDTPGHVNFVDEAASAVRLTDGAVIVVDVIEGVMGSTESLIKHAMSEGLSLVLVVNKIDRLIMELHIPTNEAYYKIQHTIEEVNAVIASVNPDPSLRLSPELGNVAFASTAMGWCFTLKSFANLYSDLFKGLDAQSFAARLWGNIYWNPKRKAFTRKPIEPESKRGFDYWILEPTYKIYSCVLSQEIDELQKTLARLGVYLKTEQLRMDVKPLLKMVLDAFFGGQQGGFIDMLVKHIPSPAQANADKSQRTYTGPMDSPTARAMLTCDADGPLMINICKLYPAPDGSEMFAFGRILSGTVRVGDRVKILGENFSPEDEEDMAIHTVEGVYINESRYRVPIDGMPAGNFVMLSGVESSITKSATITHVKNADPIMIFKPIRHFSESVLKIAIEPNHPSELPKLLDGLRKINKTYPLAQTRVEESGEHILIGTGELYLDCILHDLRRLFAEIEIKVSDPITRFCETVIETSVLRCYAETPNKKNKLTMISEPLEAGMAEDIEKGKIKLSMPPKVLSEYLQGTYSWDLLASRSIWAFGPEETSPNILMDDAITGETDKKLLYNVKESLKQGFQWATREGPLCDEPVRNVKFRILDAQLAQESIYRGGGQIIPTTRRVCYSSLLTATPRLMEPIYSVEVSGPYESIAAVYSILARRRGHVVKDWAKPGTPIYVVKGFIPVLDANGFEVDLRTATNGEAYCQMMMDHWNIMDGDPLDKSIKLRPLEPAPPLALARDAMLKTRARKGLPLDISIPKYFDQDMIAALAASGSFDSI